MKTLELYAGYKAVTPELGWLNGWGVRCRWVVALTLPWLVAGLTGCSKPEMTEARHRAEVEEWRAERDQSLRKADGWLSLVGLHWLEEGENTVGSGAGSHVLLPQGKAPSSVGTIHLAGTDIEFQAAEDAGVRVDGRDAATVRLVAEATGSETKPTILTIGSLQIYVIDRGSGYAARVKDSASEVLRTFEGMDYFEIAPEWRLGGRLEPSPQAVTVPNTSGQTYELDSPGHVVVELRGETHRLRLFGVGDEYLLVFADQTNGKETYAGGRFLYLDRSETGSRLILDFNKAYNPPCVFTPYATCPYPPKENRFGFAVPAGEMIYRGLAAGQAAAD